jgi:hypothetical protein
VLAFMIAMAVGAVSLAIAFESTAPVPGRQVG